MQPSSSYYPSPLRKDYNSQPFRNLTPKIAKLPQKSPTMISQPSTQTSQEQKYQDGTLINMQSSKHSSSTSASNQYGIFISKDYQTCVIYNIENGKLQGVNYFVYLSGRVMSVDYENGIVNGVVIVSGEGEVTVQSWKKGSREGLQYHYDYQQKLLICSVYKSNQLQLIKNGIIGQLPKLIPSSLHSRIQLLQQYNLPVPKHFPCIKKAHLKYYGQLSLNLQNPYGYGALFSNGDIYIGNFSNGYLNGFGASKIGNGSSYVGQYVNGECDGYGKWRDPYKQEYRFEKDVIDKEEFNRYIDMQNTGNNGLKWLQKYRQIQKLHHFCLYSLPSRIKEYQLSQQNRQKEQKSEVHLQIQDTQIKKQHNSQQQLMGTKNINNYGSGASKNTFVPKLSLFQKMKTKERSRLDAGDRSARNNQEMYKQLELEKKRTQTERNQRQKQNGQLSILMVTPSGVKKSVISTPKSNQNNANNKQTMNLSTKMTKPGLSQSPSPSPSFNFVNQPQYQHIATQQIKNQKWYVSPQYNFMRPNQLLPKHKINRNLEEERKAKLIKNQRQPYIDLGKIMKVGSDVNEQDVGNFMDGIGRSRGAVQGE